jgi:glycosyltransferase involved in cell wall biosynthesis
MVDDRRLEPTATPDEIRGRCGIGASEKVIGFVGRLCEQKGLRDLIEAFRVVVDKAPSARLLIVGGGALRDDLVRLARHRGVESRVTWAGARADIGNYLQIMDVFALPSRFEGLGIAVVEALWAGVPVVASSLPAIKEFVTPDWGRLVPPASPGPLAEALSELLTDDALRMSLAQAARRMARREFAPERYVRRLESVWLDLLAAKGVVPG